MKRSHVIKVIIKWARELVTFFLKKKETSIVKFLPTANLFSAAGFSLWSWWSACSKTCRSSGVAGTEERTRICINKILGCEGQIRETRTCNPEACQGKESPYLVTWSKTRAAGFSSFFFLIFHDVLVSSTLIVPVNIFTLKKEKPCSPGATKIFVSRARIELATFRILDRTF